MQLQSQGPLLVTRTYKFCVVMNFHTKLLLLALSLVHLVQLVLCGNVLVLCPMSSQSHRNVFEGIYSGLAGKGHQITVVMSGKPSKSKPTNNVKEILVYEEFDYFPKLSTLEIRKGGIWGLIMADHSHLRDYCRRFYEHPEVQKLMNQSFDVILHDLIGNQCVAGLMYKLGSPMISVSTCTANNFVTSPFGLRLPPSFVPDFMNTVAFTDEMNFWQRTWNLILRPISNGAWKIFDKMAEETYRKYLGQDVPDVAEIFGNASLLLSNAHLSFESPRPALPDHIEFGGAHCREGESLPPELDEFISGAKDGLILFSLGSIVKAHELPDETRKVFLRTFAILKQRVLWKWPLAMDDAPPNVKISKWVPQQDVLAHPNTKLFITHGGLLSTQEAIYHGVAMVYLPVFGDQDMNAGLATVHGIGISLEILDVTEDSFKAAIDQVLGTPKYQENINRLSQIFRCQPETPKERAVFWTEYIMRHKGAPHLRSAARKLNTIQYYSLDSLALIAAVLLVTLWVLKKMFLKVIKTVASILLSRRSVASSKKKTS